MQPVKHRRRDALGLTALFVAMAAATLLLTLCATAGTAHASAPSRAPAATNAAPGWSVPAGDGEVVPRGALEQMEFTLSNFEVVGVVASSPITGFVGSWQIADSGKVVTVIVSSSTNIKGFNNVPPRKNAWVEAKVLRQADGSLLVTKFRPNTFQPGEIVARLAPTAVLAEVLNTYRQYRLAPIESLLSSGRIYRFSISKNWDEAAVAAIFAADKANFLWAEVNYMSEIPSGPLGNPYRTWKWGSHDETGYISQNALQQIDLPPVQGVYSGTNVIVAVLDSGIDATHPVLAGHILPGIDLVNDDEIPQDGPEPGEPHGPAEGHGTHISGIVTLVAPESKILPVRVLDVDGRGSTFVLAYAIDWAVAQGASVINLSLGSDADATVLEESIARAQSQGVVIAAAAGNDNWADPQYPAAYPGVLGVTAVDDASHKADFANYGSGWVDLAAPGVAITSTIPVSGTVLYATWSGTSMAVPFVSGAAALVRQQSPTAEIGSLLVQTGRDLDRLNPSYAGQLGRLLNIEAALPVPVSPTPTQEPTPILAPTPTSAAPTPVEPTPLPTSVVSSTTDTTGTGSTTPPGPGTPGSTPMPQTPVFEATPTATPTATQPDSTEPTAAPTTAPASTAPAQAPAEPTPLPPTPISTLTATPTPTVTGDALDVPIVVPELAPYLFLPVLSR